MALFSALRSSNDKDKDKEKKEAKRLAAPVISAPVKETASKESTPKVSPFLKGNGSEVSPEVSASAAKLDALASKTPTVTWYTPEPVQTTTAASTQTGNYLTPTQRQESIAQQTQDFYRGLTTSTTPTTSPYATNRLSALDLRRMADPEFSQSDSARLVSGSASAGALGSAAGFVGAAATLAKVSDILHRGVTNQDVLDRRNALNNQMAAARTALRNGDAATARAYTESVAQLREELTELEEHLEDKARRSGETKLSQFVNAAERMYDTLAAKRDAETAYAQRGQNIIGQYAGKLITTGTQMAGDALMNIIPGGGLAAMGVRASGDASQQAALNGASVGEQLVYGAAVGAVEVLTEKMFDGLAGIYGKGDADEAVKLIINHMSTTEGGRKLLNLFASGLGELSEEVVSGIIDPALETIYNGKQVGEMYTKETAAEILEDAIVGGLLGLLGGGTTVAKTNYTETLDAITNEYMALDGADKMNYKTARQKAAIVEKALDGGKLSAIDINALDLTNAAKRDVFNRATGLQLDESVNQLLSQPDGRQQLAKQIQDGITTEQAQAAREGATEAVAARMAEIQTQQAVAQNVQSAVQEIVNAAPSKFDKANTLTYNEFKNRFLEQNGGFVPLSDEDLTKSYDQYLAAEGEKAGDQKVMYNGQLVTFRQLQAAMDQLADKAGEQHIAEPVLEQEFEQRVHAQSRPSEIPSDISIPLPGGTTLNYEQFKEAALQNAGAETATEEELAKEFLDIAKERGVINQKLYDNLLGGIINGRDGVHNDRLAGLSDQSTGEQTGRVAGTAGEAEGESARSENVPLELGVAEQTGEISRRVKASRQAGRVNEAGVQTHKVKRGNDLVDLNVINEADEAKIFDATPGLRDLVREARAEGYEVLLVTEPIATGKVNKNGKPETADGMHTGRRIVVQVNSVTRPAQNLFGHEYHHARYENDLTYRAAVDSFVGEIRDDGELNLSIRDHYNTEDGPYFLQFGNFSDNYADYYEELVADLAGDFNRCLLPQADFNLMRKAYKSVVREAEAKAKARTEKMQAQAVQAVGGTDTVTTENLQVAADDIFPADGIRDEKFSVGLFRAPAEKQEIRLLSGDTKSTPAKTASGRDVLQQALKKSGKSAKQISKVMKFMDAAAEFMDKAQLEYKFIGLQDINDAKLVISPRDGHIVLSAMVKNGEYPVNFDLTKVCARRVAMDQFVSELAHRPGKNGKDTMLEEVPLTQENIFRMNEIMRDAGYDTACLGCFVESRRYNIQEWASSFVDEYNELVEKINPDAEFFGFTKRDVFTDDLTKEQISALNDELERYKAGLTTARKEKGSNLNIPEKIEVLVRSSEAMQKKLKVADLITQDGRTNLHKLSPELESLVLGHYGSNTPKSVEVFTPYNNEIALLSEDVPNYSSLKEYLTHIAGVRSQSFSDFIITHMFDVLQKTADLYARDLPAHTYTKVPSRVRLFGMTGEKINMSIMFNIDPGVDWAHAGLRENGDYFVGDKATMEAEKAAGREQTFDQSFPWDEAVEIMKDPRYSKDCGTIGVGYSYHHIMKMLSDDDIRYIIGYHSSGMPSEIKVATHIQSAADYTPVQNTLAFKGFKFVKNTNDYDVPSYASWGQGQKETTSSDATYDLAGECKRVGPRAAMQNFLHFAEERSLVPDTSTAELTVPSKKPGGKLKTQEQKGHGDFDLYEDLAKTKSPRKTTENYMRWCLEQNMLPVFYEFSTHPNYYKLLFDFNVIDPLTGKYAPQRGVDFKFPENFFDLVDQYMAEADLKAKEQSEKFEPTLEKIYEELSAGEEKFSVSGGHEYPDLTKKEHSLLDYTLKKEINSDENYLNESTKWAYNEEKGISVFSLYGIGDGTDPTPLYASGGVQARKDRSAMQRFVEGDATNDVKDRAALIRLLEDLESGQAYRGNGLFADANGRAEAEDVSLSGGQRGRDERGDRRGDEETIPDVYDAPPGAVRIDKLTRTTYVDPVALNEIKEREAPAEAGASSMPEPAPEVAEKRYENATPVEKRAMAMSDLRYMEENPNSFRDSSSGESVKYSVSADAQDNFHPLRNENGEIKYVYKAFYARDGKLYPPMVSNITNQVKTVKGAVSGTLRGLDTPVGVVLTADVGKLGRYKADATEYEVAFRKLWKGKSKVIKDMKARGFNTNTPENRAAAMAEAERLIPKLRNASKTELVERAGELVRNEAGRLAVVNDKGGDILAFRPGWHLGEWPDAKQFNKDSPLGKKTVMPNELVFAKCEIAGDVDYQLQAMSLGVKKNGKYDRTQAGLPRIPVNGYYKYRTNPDPDTAPWYITGAIRVVEILDDADCAEICAQYGVTPSPRESGKPIRLEDYGLKHGPVTAVEDITPYAKNEAAMANEQELRQALSDPAYADAYVGRAINFDDPEIIAELKRNGQDIDRYRALAEDKGYTNWRGEERYSVASEPNLGYHAGDLGKAETYWHMGGSRGTGHFGTGTYFVGDEAQLQKSGDTYGQRPVEKVDFSKYNLFRPNSTQLGYQLHDMLKGINANIENLDAAERDSMAYIDDMYEAKRALTHMQYTDDEQEIAQSLRTVQDYVDKYFTDREKEDFNAIPQDKFFADNVEKAIEEHDAFETRLHRWYQHLPLEALQTLGITSGKLDRALWKAKQTIDSYGGREASYGKPYDSASTVFMKALGYDGIDVRGLNGLDNTTFGSVIYDLKDEDLARKKEIGTARYSVSPELQQWFDQLKSGEDGLGAADAGSVNSLYDQLQAQSKNFHPSGPAPVRHTDVPTKDFAGRNVPKSASTIYGAQGTTTNAALQLEQMIANGQLSFDTETDQKAVNKAKRTMNGKGFDGAMEQYRQNCQNGIASKENTALGQQLLLRAMKEGNDAATAELLTLYTRNSTTVAQALQAQSMFRKLSPEGQLVGLRKAINDLNEKYGTDIELTGEEIRDFTNARSQEEREAVHGRIVNRIANLLPKNFKAKFDTIRYLAMLGNPRTHIRNILGNALFQAPVMAKNRVGAIGEAIASAVSGGKVERTKSLTGIKSAELLAEARADFEKVKDHLGNISKYNEGKSVKSEIEQQAPAFANKGLGRAINWASEKNGALLEAEDMAFKKFIYIQSLAGYLQANGVSSIAEAERSIEGRKLLNRARNYAEQEAMRNTFNDRNMFSDAVASLSSLTRSDNKVKRAAGYVTEGIVPFKRTPTNILVRAGEYSPIGAANGIVEIINGAKSGDSAKVTQGIDRLAAGLTGSALMYLGWVLAGAGKLRGGEDDDDKQKNFDALRGRQNYSIETADGKSVTLDWLAPEAIPFFMGAELYNASLEGGLSADDVTKVFKNTTAPMLEMSMLQSLNDMFENAAYAKNNNGSVLGSVLTSALTSYITQVFPTILGQAERTAETERMTTYTDKNSGVPTDLQYTLGKISQKIPKWDYGQIPYIDAWGRTKETGNAAERAVNNFANPAYLSDVSDDAMEDELQRLYDETGENVLPQRADRKIKVNGEDKDLTADEYVEYATLRGTLSYDLVNSFVNDPAYSSLSDTEKAHAIRDLYSYANDKAKAELFGAENKNTAKFDEAVSLGISPEDYALSQAVVASLEPTDGHSSVTNMQKYRAIDSTGMSQSEKAAAIGLVMGNEMLTEAGNPSQYAKMLDLLNTGMTVSHYLDVKQMHDVIGDGEGTAAQKATKFVKALNDTPWLTDQQRAMASDYFTYSFGATAEANQKALAAEQYGISIDDFYRIKGAVDADGNGSMSKAELTAYLNANYPAAQRRALFELFGGSKWNNPY